MSIKAATVRDPFAFSLRGATSVNGISIVPVIRDDALRCARLAKASAADTGVFCSNRSTQLHGGIGFTWEMDVQIFHKRQMHSQFLYGDGPWNREKLAELL